MTNLDKFAEGADSLSGFATEYFSYLRSVLDSVDPDAIDGFGAELEDARENGHTVFVAGNGGSAATATTQSCP